MSTFSPRPLAPSPAPNENASPRYALVIVVAVLLAWSGSIRGPFVFDDHEAVVHNATLADFWSMRWLVPPATAGETVSGRPVLNFTFALNHALGGLDPRGYHSVNAGLHALAALLAFGVVRRTLRRQQPAIANGLAATIALAWALHPLQTAAVTYVAQRAESLAGLWFLLALYAFIRAGESESTRLKWSVVSVVAFLLGTGTKETVAALPVVAAAWDRVFAAGSWREVWQRNGRLLLTLAACWLPLAVLVLAHDGRGGSAGWATTITPWSYLLTQAAAIPHYLRLMIWPAGLVFDYGTPVASSLSAVWLPMLALAAAFAFSAWSAWRGRAAGFMGLLFFAVLAPSSSIVPVATQTIAEHRCYLALLPVLAGMILLVHRVARSWPAGLQAVLAAALVVALGTATWQRNRVYQSAVSLWQDTVNHRPNNARAFNNLGQALALEGNPAGAIAAYESAIALAPEHAFAHGNLGAQLLISGQLAAAETHLNRALELDPHLANARFNLADVLARQGRRPAAIHQLRLLLAQDRAALDVHLKLATLLTADDATEEAAQVLRDAEALAPHSAEVAFAQGTLHVKRRDLPAALHAFTAAVDRDPAHWDARANLANCQLMAGQPRDAIANYEAVLRARPDDAQTRSNLALAREMVAKP